MYQTTKTYYNACAQQVKNAVIAHLADHHNGPFSHTQQYTKKITMQI
jgi:hypothetical protein